MSVCLFYCVVVFWKREKQGRVTLLFLFILDVTNGQSTEDYASDTSIAFFDKRSLVIKANSFHILTQY